jgi:hypothetical protein
MPVGRADSIVALFSDEMRHIVLIVMVAFKFLLWVLVLIVTWLSLWPGG